MTTVLRIQQGNGAELVEQSELVIAGRKKRSFEESTAVASESQTLKKRAAEAIEVLSSRPGARLRYENGELSEITEARAPVTSDEDRRRRMEEHEQALRDASQNTGQHGNDAAYRRRRIAEREREMERPDAFRVWLQDGRDALALLGEEFRAQSVGTDSAGGFLAPARFSDRIFANMKATDRLFDENVVSLVTTDPGTKYSIPVLDDTASSSGIVNENVGSALTPDLVFDQLVLPKVSTYRTSMVKVPIELIQDSNYDLEQLLADAFAIRLRRGIGASLVTTLAGAAVSGVSAGANSIVPNNLFDLFASVDPEYLASPKCGWLMRLSTLIAISKLVDSAGAPIFPITRGADGEFELMTRPVWLCPSVAAIGTTNRSVFFGAMDFFVVRRVAGSLRVIRQKETYAEFGQVGFRAFLRVNAGLAKASTADSPIKFLQHS